MQFEIFGIKELDDFFNTLKVTDQKKIVTDAFRIGSKPIIETAKAYLEIRRKHKSKTNNLSKSIGFIAGKGKTIITARIGARRFGPYKGFHGHLFDAGTVERSIKRTQYIKTKKGKRIIQSGDTRGTMIGTHFFTDAVASQSDAATNQMQQNLIQSVDKIIQRGIKKFGNKTYGQVKGRSA